MPLRFNAGKTIIAIFLGVVVLVGLIATMVLTQPPALRTQSVAKVVSNHVASEPAPKSRVGDLGQEQVAKLIQTALAASAVVVRLTLGDIVTIDADEHERSQDYAALANAGVIELKLCNFPGRAQGPRQVCIADLTDAARRYAQDLDLAKQPLKIITPADDVPAAANRRVVDLVVARAELVHTDAIARSDADMQTIAYTAAYRLTPIAERLAVTVEALPAPPNRARFKKTLADWRLVQIQTH